MNFFILNSTIHLYFRLFVSLRFDLFDDFNSEMEQNEKVELKLTHSKRNDDKKVATMDKILFQMKKNREIESQLMEDVDKEVNMDENKNNEAIITNELKQPSPSSVHEQNEKIDQQPPTQMETDDNTNLNKREEENAITMAINNETNPGEETKTISNNIQIVDLDPELMINKQFDETNFKTSQHQEEQKSIELTTSSDPYQLKENL
jgi:hypothetical protein